MGKSNHNRSSTISAEYDPEELRMILYRIDEHLAFRQIVKNDTHVVGDRLEKSEPSFLFKLVSISDRLKMSSAPLHPSIGIRGVHGILLRLKNLPIRIFGSGQINFNRELREFIGELMNIIHEFNAQRNNFASSMLNLYRKLGPISDLDTKVSALEASNHQYQEEINRLNKQVEVLRQGLERVEKQLDDH